MINILNTNSILTKLTENIFSTRKPPEYIANVLPISFCIHNANKEVIYASKSFKKLNIKLPQSTQTELIINNNTYKVIHTPFISPKFQKLSLITLIDITEIKQKEKEHEASMAIIAHDLKSPILAETQALKLLLGEKFGSLTTSQKEILELLYNTNLYSKLLIDNTLSAYKMHTKGLDLNLTTFDICKTITICKEIYDITASDKELNLKLSIPREYYIEADQNEIQRVIMNLLGNAIKYSFENSPIEIRLDYTDRSIFFHINSFGGYIPANVMKKLFDRNVSMKRNGSTLGTGLGLYLCKEIIKKHNGEIVAQSYPNGLNVFGFKINISQPSKKQSPQGLISKCKQL